MATLANTLILATAPPERAGAAAGVSETSTELGAALGIATLGAIATSVYHSGVEQNLPEAGGAALETVAGAAATAAHLPEAEAATLLDTAFTAYASGVEAAALTGAAVLTAVTLLVLVALRRLPAGTEAPAHEEPETEPGGRPGRQVGEAVTPRTRRGAAEARKQDRPPGRG